MQFCPGEDGHFSRASEVSCKETCEPRFRSWRPGSLPQGSPPPDHASRPCPAASPAWLAWVHPSCCPLLTSLPPDRQILILLDIEHQLQAVAGAAFDGGKEFMASGPRVEGVAFAQTGEDLGREKTEKWDEALGPSHVAGEQPSWLQVSGGLSPRPLFASLKGSKGATPDLGRGRALGRWVCCLRRHKRPGTEEPESGFLRCGLLTHLAMPDSAVFLPAQPQWGSQPGITRALESAQPGLFFRSMGTTQGSREGPSEEACCLPSNVGA